jgi:adenylate cyclase
VALAAGLAAAAARTDWVRSLENIYYDYAHILAGVRNVPERTALVAVDDETLAMLKDDPLAFWAPHFARAIGALTQAGVKAIGFDFLYQVSAESWLKKLNLPESDVSRSYDGPLRAAFASGNTVLIVHLVARQNGELELLMPPPDQLLLLPRGVDDLGIANLYPDGDKHVRRFFPVLDPDPQKPGLSFALQLALRVAGADPSAPEWTLAGTRFAREVRLLPIGYAGPPGTVPTVSMSRLLQPGAAADPKVRALKGKVVILAANNTGTPDAHFTPYSRGAAAVQMAGGEIHANIVETLLSGRYPAPPPSGVASLYAALVALVATLCFFRLPVQWGALAAAGFAIAIPLLAYAAFLGNLVLPAAEPQIGVGLVFLAVLGLRLTGEERERARIRQLFGRYVSDEVVEKLLADKDRPDLQGEAATVTVLFSDIRNFTTLSERLSAHEVVEMLNAYFSRACEPILAQGGTVDKYIGDAVMALFGSPVKHPDHARRAVRAALGVARAAEGFGQWMRERFPGKDLPEFGVGIGLHTGEAVIGDIGTPKRRDFTAIGDTVNAASRLEGITKEMGCRIVASEATVRSAGQGVVTGKSENVKVKGKSEPIKVFEVLELKE